MPELFESIPLPWQSHLEHLREELFAIEKSISQTSYNPQGRIFAALEMNPEDVKVVILGQDPYPDASHAMGLAFAIPSTTKRIPPSLQNILKEIEADIGKSSSVEKILTWPSQGVLMLNTYLTCKVGKSLSHKDVGWTNVTNTILEVVSKNDPVGILWGSHAKKYAGFFQKEFLITGVHPSPLSAYKGFFGSKPFSRANEALRSSARTGIDW